MRILLLTHSFNSLAQRLFLALQSEGHALSVEFDISDRVTADAVQRFQPDLVLAPFLKRAIAPEVWQNHCCLIVHPGPPGDRGPSSLDWALMQAEPEWGVTVLQAVAELDAGPIWASRRFPMRAATKSSLYRREVSDAAVAATMEAVQRLATGAGPPLPEGDTPSVWRPPMRQEVRRIAWQRDDTETVYRKMRAADGAPGVLDALFGRTCHLFDAHPQPLPPASPLRPGELLCHWHGAVLRGTRDGAVWIGQARRLDGENPFKLPTTLAFAAECTALPPWPHGIDGQPPDLPHCEPIRYERHGAVGVLHFAFYNGALDAGSCRRLTAALQAARADAAPVLLLAGGPEFWCNGIHLHVIEAADQPAETSWATIQAMDDLTQGLIETTDQFLIATLQGNAAAGGAFMALAADEVWARPAVVLNPHYKNMGNLYGSEYWTYLLPRRLHGQPVSAVMEQRLPLSAHQAQALGLVDVVFDAQTGPEAFMQAARVRAQALAADPRFPERLQRKAAQRAADEARRPLTAYREEELAQMHRNFFGFDPSYHIARSNFVRRVPHSWTPRHLARHRDR